MRLLCRRKLLLVVRGLSVILLLRLLPVVHMRVATWSKVAIVIHDCCSATRRRHDGGRARPTAQDGPTTALDSAGESESSSGGLNSTRW